MADNKELKPNNTDTTDGIKHSSLIDREKEASKDEPDPGRFFWSPSSKKEEAAKMPVGKDASHYNMKHSNRGIALILNHEQFVVPNLKQRNGTPVDKDRLETLLQELGFEVWSFTDLELAGVKKAVYKAAAHDHSDSDCFVLAVLSHGGRGILYAKDCGYDPELLWTPFTGDQCKSLAGKPKLFFIQACQGDDSLDGGIKLRKHTEVDGIGNYRIPIHADFLVAFSIVPGHCCWRNTTKGSWFIQALCEVLNKYAFDRDLMTILTLVLQKVAIDYESNVPDNPNMHNQKEMPYISTMLTRLVAFRRKELY